MFTKIYLLIVAVADLCFFLLFIVKCFQKKDTIKEESGNSFLLSLYALILQGLAAFGISDFSVSIVVYRKFKLVKDEKLPGTLLTACVMPVGIMAIGYISTVEVDQNLLIICVISGILGSIVGTSVVSKLNTNAIQIMMALVLLFSGIIMFVQLVGAMPSGGEELSFKTWKLVVTSIVTFILSGLSMGGFAVTAVMLCFFTAMGLNSLAAFPLAMGTCALSVAFGGVQYIKKENLNFKLALTSNIFGTIGALVAVNCIQSFDTRMLKWIILVVALYTAVTMLLQEKNRRNEIC